MPIDITMPKMSLTMTEGKIIQWLKKEGEDIKKSEPLLVIETDKVSCEIEAPTSGVLKKILVPEGSNVPVNSPIGIIAGADEKIQEMELPKAYKTIQPQPPKIDAAAIPQEEVRLGSERITASPLAKKLAALRNVDLTKVKGTGPGGRIVKEDVERAAEARLSLPQAAAVVMPTPAVAEGKEMVLTGIRQTIAQRMFHSLQSTAQLTITMEADVTQLVFLHKMSLKDRGVSLTDVLLKVVAKSLVEHPIVNSILEGDRIRLLDNVNVGVAVAVEGGLIVPVVWNADKKPLREISSLTKSLIDKARSGKLTPEDVGGGTFTISNLGMFGVEIFTPILNPPESGILGIGKIIEKPSVHEGQVTIRSKMSLSLTFDHRVFDGAQAAQFLQTVKESLENPLLLLH